METDFGIGGQRHGNVVVDLFGCMLVPPQAVAQLRFQSRKRLSTGQ
jgi:hypothetical protein